MDSWILAVLIMISLQLVWMGSRLGTTTGKGGLPEDLLGELRKIREELYWFKDDKFAGHLIKEINENCENLEREITEINRSLVKIDATLDDLKEIASR